MNGVADSSSLNKPNKNKFKYMHAYFLYFYILYFIFFYCFWGWPSLAHMGWAGPSQPGQVSGPSQ